MIHHQCPHDNEPWNIHFLQRRYSLYVQIHIQVCVKNLTYRFNKPWIFLRCISLHDWRTRSAIMTSHVELLLHIQCQQWRPLVINSTVWWFSVIVVAYIKGQVLPYICYSILHSLNKSTYFVIFMKKLNVVSIFLIILPIPTVKWSETDRKLPNKNIDIKYVGIT